MKTNDEIIKGIEARIGEVEIFLNTFAPGTEHYESIKNSYWEQSAVHSELCLLLEWVRGCDLSEKSAK